MRGTLSYTVQRQRTRSYLIRQQLPTAKPEPRLSPAPSSRLKITPVPRLRDLLTACAVCPSSLVRCRHPLPDTPYDPHLLSRAATVRPIQRERAVASQPAPHSLAAAKSSP